MGVAVGVVGRIDVSLVKTGVCRSFSFAVTYKHSEKVHET